MPLSAPDMLYSMDEPALIRFFVDLTGDSEGAARCVLMYLEMLEHDYYPNRSLENANASVPAEFDRAAYSGAPIATPQPAGVAYAAA